jgi:hypothetical protein
VSHQLLIFELSAQHDDPPVGVDADLSFGNRPVAEELAFDLAHEADVVEVWREVVTVRDLVGESDGLARLVTGVALDSAGAASEGGGCTVTSDVSSAAAATWVEEELQSDASREGRLRDSCQLTG